MIFDHADSWAPLLKKPKTIQSITGVGDYQYYTELYLTDPMVQKIVKLKPAEATKQTPEFIMADQPEISAWVNSELKRLNALGVFEEAGTWAQLHGGSAIVWDLDNGLTLEQPLMNGIRSVNNLKIIEASEIRPETVTGRMPEFYLIQERNGQSERIHVSRFFKLYGNKVPPSQCQQYQYWGQSVVESLLNSVEKYNEAHEASSYILNEFYIAIYKVKGLAAALKANQADKIRDRFGIMNDIKSIYRAFITDENEQFERQSANVSGLSDLVSNAERRLIAASKIPHSLLLGESAGASLGESGNAQRSDWYDQVRSYQLEQMLPFYEQLCTLILMQTKGMTRGLIPKNPWHVEIKPLQLPSEKEKLETREIQARIDETYINSGVLTVEEVAQSRFGGSEWTAETQLDSGLVRGLDVES